MSAFLHFFSTLNNKSRALVRSFHYFHCSATAFVRKVKVNSATVQQAQCKHFFCMQETSRLFGTAAAVVLSFHSSRDSSP